LTTFSYIAIDPKGREIKGTLEAESQAAAAQELKRSGLTIASLAETGVLSKDISLGFLEKGPKPRDMAVFCRQFVSIINAGVPVVTALEMLALQTENKKLRATIGQCKRDIETGESLASAMGKHRKVFSDIFITMVEAGEVSGSLDTSFTRMAEQFEKDAKLKATIKKASIYPVVVFAVAIAVVIAMLMFVVPTFETMFAELGTELPGITKAIIGASAFLKSYWYLILLGVVVLVFLFRAFRRGDSGRRLLGTIAMKAPLFGKLTVKGACARFARSLSTLLFAGIPMMDALDICKNLMTNIHFLDAVETARDDVSVGNPLSDTIRRSGVFPPLVYHMIGIGEETGDIEEMLSKLADYYEDEVEQTTQQVMAALEPMIIILLALLVGVIVLSVILPLATMYGALDNL
jgi:type IV pilus assembly protein PilC